MLSKLGALNPKYLSLSAAIGDGGQGQLNDKPFDFSGTKFMDFSCADELVVKLIKRVTGGDLAGRYVILRGLQESVRENIQAALELRQIVCVYETAKGGPELLGKVNQEIQEAYDLAKEKGRITARDVVEQTGKTISASSNRLTRLKELGILVCVTNEAVETGERQNVYEPVG
jgi:hypothetical protein